MLATITRLFAHLCGQKPDHTWTLGGWSLPCCQRCTGLYAGAAIAALLLVWLRPRLSGRFLGAHGACLLFLAPLGLHWVPEGPLLRTLSGVLFGFGVAAFLWLPLASKYGWADCPRRFAAGGYPLALIGTAVLIPLLASVGGAGTAVVLIVLICAGAIAFLTLALGALFATVSAPR